MSSTSDAKALIMRLAFSLLVLMPLSAMWYGFVFARLWNWFMVPGLGAHSLSVGYAIGILITIDILFVGMMMQMQENETASTTRTLAGATCVGAILGMGAIVHAVIA